MISIRNLKKSYGTFHVLAGLDLDILENETLVLLGRSGVGKSVLLKHIIGITKPDEGSIFVDGICISELSGPALYEAIRNMGMLFQGGALFDSMDVEANVAFYLKEHGDHLTGKRCTKAEIKDRVAHALEMVGLEGTEQKMPAELSGGMRKRAALARLIVYRPKVFLYDEPTTGLDPITSMQINELIVKTQEELKATSIVVTHDILSAHYVANRMALIKEGKIAHLAKPNDFIKIQDPFIDFFKRVSSA
ncbi:MAG TPA: ATP-binding cassette domain-containing protein [Rhabdochlamydiaceae bacterium]|nr:ATP-binding cassette domain-containing protein [Rhabdochlamydiaceae bacterium]